MFVQDEELVAFKDIKPAATHHYLIIPRQHISDAKILTSADKPLGNVLYSNWVSYRFAETFSIGLLFILKY